MDLSLDEVIARKPGNAREDKAAFNRNSAPRRYPPASNSRRSPNRRPFDDSRANDRVIMRRGGGGGRWRGSSVRLPPRGNVNETWKHDLFKGGDEDTAEQLTVTVQKGENGSIENRHVEAGDHMNMDEELSLKTGGLRGSSGRPVRSPPGFAVSVDNLFYEVTEQELKDLFTAIGPLKRARIQYDAAGRSLGSAMVVFESESDAHAAVSKYDGANLDGQNLKLEFKGEELPVFRQNHRDNRPSTGRSHPYQSNGRGRRRY